MRARLEEICTAGELDVARAKAAGYGRRAGSLLLGISEEAWRYRWRRIVQKLRSEEAA